MDNKQFSINPASGADSTSVQEQVVKGSLSSPNFNDASKREQSSLLEMPSGSIIGKANIVEELEEVDLDFHKYDYRPEGSRRNWLFFVPERDHTWGLHSLWLWSVFGCFTLRSSTSRFTGWSEQLRYSLMPLGDFARRQSPCSHRSSMALPLIPPCRDQSVTESALSGCLSASRPHTHGSFRR